MHWCFQEGRVRVTLLARSTEYRKILNQVEVSAAPTSHPSFCLSFFLAFVILLPTCPATFTASLFILLVFVYFSFPLPQSLLSIIDLLPAAVKCLFKILFAINGMCKKDLWFIWSLPVFVFSLINQRTRLSVVVTAGKCPQDCAFTGGQCGGLQIQVSYRVLVTLLRELWGAA